MKTKLLGVCAIILFVLNGCSKDNALSEGAKSIDKKTLQALNLDGAPNWVLNGGQGDMGAVGITTIVEGDVAYARTEALALARDELARQVATEVEGVFSRMQSMSAESMQKTSKQIIEQSVSQTLTGTKQTDMWISKDSSQLFILVKLSPELKEKLKTNVKIRVKNSTLASRIKEEMSDLLDTSFLSNK